MKEQCKKITFEVLIDYYEGRLAGVKAEQVERHLSNGCESCRRELNWMSRYMPAVHQITSDVELHAPARTLNAAFQIYRDRFNQQSRFSLPVLIARLIFDSRPQPSLVFAGARGGSYGENQVVYSTGEYDIDLWQEPTGEGLWYVIGQVLSRQGEDAITPDRVLLTANDGRTLLGKVEAGEFCLGSTPAGVYEARVTLPFSEIVLPDVAIGQ